MHDIRTEYNHTSSGAKTEYQPSPIHPHSANATNETSTTITGYEPHFGNQNRSSFGPAFLSGLVPSATIMEERPLRGRALEHLTTVNPQEKAEERPHVGEDMARLESESDQVGVLFSWSP